MNPNYKRWQMLFLGCLGLALGAGFCMKWMEDDLVQQGGKFSIIGLEISYSREQIISIFRELDEPVKNILRYHLYFDFAYMLGVFPGIAALCMMAREKTMSSRARSLLLSLGLLQIVAWGCDIFENIQLLNWIAAPDSVSSLGIYHLVVWTKWVLAILGIIVALCFVFRRKKQYR